MAAYLIVDVQVADPAAYERYRAGVATTLVPYGGKFMVRGGRFEMLEGNWDLTRLVVIEFPSMERAKEWWSSKEYAPLKQLRHSAARTRMVVVEGV
jgi:uncharacterized protein (DUF1330 family)